MEGLTQECLYDLTEGGKWTDISFEVQYPIMTCYVQSFVNKQPDSVICSVIWCKQW